MILDRGLGHPARWLDVAFAWQRLQDEYLINLVLESYFDVVVMKDVTTQLVVRAVPSPWSPHAGKKPIVKNRVWLLGPDKPISEGIYGLLWEVDNTVGLVWPIGHTGEGRLRAGRAPNDT